MLYSIWLPSFRGTCCVPDRNKTSRKHYRYAIAYSIFKTQVGKIGMGTRIIRLFGSQPRFLFRSAGRCSNALLRYHFRTIRPYCSRYGSEYDYRIGGYRLGSSINT